MFAVFRVWAPALTGTQLSGKVDVVPQSGSLTVAPIAVVSVTQIGVGLAVRKGPVL